MEMSGLQKLVQKNGFFKKGHSRPLFLYFCLFNALGNTQCLIKTLPSMGFEPRTSGVRSDCFAD